MTNQPESSPERRNRQRFAAVRDGKPCVQVVIADHRHTVCDLSLEGFSISWIEGLETGCSFNFEMRLVDGFGDRVRGQARVVNQTGQLSGMVLGCCFESIEDNGQKTLQEWLTVIVICGASVRLSPADAEAIVNGPSLI